MARGLAIVLSLVFLAATLTILSQYYITSMASTAQGVNLTTAPQEVQDAYNVSTQTTIAAIGISHYEVLLVSIMALAIILVVAILMAKNNRRTARM